MPRFQAILPVESDQEKILSLAIARDTTLRSTRNSIETAVLNKSIRESSCLPSLSANFSCKFNFSPDPTYPGSKSFQPAWNIGIQLSMGLDDLLWFSQTQNAIREQAETREKYELAYLARVKVLEYEVDSLFNQLSEQRAVIAAKQENAVIFKITRKPFPDFIKMVHINRLLTGNRFINDLLIAAVN